MLKHYRTNIQALKLHNINFTNNRPINKEFGFTCFMAYRKCWTTTYFIHLQHFFFLTLCRNCWTVLSTYFIHLQQFFSLTLNKKFRGIEKSAPRICWFSHQLWPTFNPLIVIHTFLLITNCRGVCFTHNFFTSKNIIVENEI